MVFVLCVLALAVGVGLLAGGGLGRLGELELRRAWLVVAALGLQLAGSVLGGVAYPLGLLLSVGLVGWFLMLNRGVRGVGLVALGLGANALVVGLNGAMPVSLDASGRAGISIQDILSGRDPRHELATEQTRLQHLGDVVPVLLPLRPEVVSVGDVLVAAGLAQLVVVGMGAGMGAGRRA